MAELTILFVADICGKTGRQAASYLIKDLREEYQADLVIANIENAAGGFGITPEMSRKIFSYGVDVQTSGNHIWDRVDILEFINDNRNLIRPANYPGEVPGSGYVISKTASVPVAVINLMGRTYMSNIDCPFQTARKIINSLPPDVRIIFIDFHAEATSEKQAMMYFLDGQVSAVIGTHTHVQTADEQITKRGTAYITDAGMTGPHESIIGMEIGPSLGRFLTGLPKRFTSASGDVKLSGVLLKVDTEDGRATYLERLKIDFDLMEYQKKKAETESKEGS